MGRSRFKITEVSQPHFLTCTVLEWLPVFTRPKSIQIILDSWQHLRQHEQFKLYGYVILENHPHKVDRGYQFWQEGSHPELITQDVVMRQKLEYIHQNPVKRGYVERAEHWRYSSARNYAGIPGLIDVDGWS